MKGLKRAILKKVFKVQNTNAMFVDAINKYYTAAANVTITPKRKGQLIYGKSGSTEAVYLAKATTGTGTAAWSNITALGG